MPRPMDAADWRAFVSEGTRTGKLGLVRLHADHVLAQADIAGYDG